MNANPLQIFLDNPTAVLLLGLEVRVPHSEDPEKDVLRGTAERLSAGDQVTIRLDDGSPRSVAYDEVRVVDMDAYRRRAKAISSTIHRFLDGGEA